MVWLLVFSFGAERVAPARGLGGVSHDATAYPTRNQLGCRLDDPANEAIMSDDKPMWDQPSNVESAPPDLASDLAKRHGISVVRAQMLIDRIGTDLDRLNEAAKDLRINPKA